MMSGQAKGAMVYKFTSDIITGKRNDEIPSERAGGMQRSLALLSGVSNI